MKRLWEVEELVEQFSVSATELQFVHGRTDYVQLGLMTLLKFFVTAQPR